ncbi:MAG: CZB domain-containing protein [Elusimicrobia bacterium]|nr:CZB domain-containing protein [Elusimicrobiota bacterium]
MAWKKSLQEAVDRGASGFTPDLVRLDDRCELGKFLNDEVSAEWRKKSHFLNIKVLHLEFHLAAAEVLEFALAGKKVEGYYSLGPEGMYSRVSAALITAIKAWEEDPESV